MEKPLFVIVSGAPGSGKTTLAGKLAAHMRLLHIPRDEFLWGMTYTANAHINRGAEGIDAYYNNLIHLGKAGISLVTDGTIYKGISEADITEKLAPVARLMNVHCRAEGEKERWYQREVARYGAASAQIVEHLAHLDKIYADAVDPLELNCPRLEVDTTEGYTPVLSEVADWLDNRNGRLMQEAAFKGRRESTGNA